jgi:hypothetical protein
MSNARDVTDYYLFYATNELLGLKKMKEACGGRMRAANSASLTLPTLTSLSCLKKQRIYRLSGRG